MTQPGDWAKIDACLFTWIILLYFTFISKKFREKEELEQTDRNLIESFLWSMDFGFCFFLLHTEAILFLTNHAAREKLK